MREHTLDTITLAPMDYVRGALFNALESGLTLDDVCRMAANADSPEAFDRAVNMLAQTLPVQGEAYPEFSDRMTVKAMAYLDDDARNMGGNPFFLASIAIGTFFCAVGGLTIFQAWVA